MTRKLASIQRVVKVEPIEGADMIEKITVLGWELVAKKSEFKVGDLCVYFECDSILPPHLIFEFLQPRRYRVRTIKLRKQISQGIAMPISILYEFGYKNSPSLSEGYDVTEMIGVIKYDPERSVENPIVRFLMNYAIFRMIYFFIEGRKPKGGFPSFVPKTDEERIQNIPNIAHKHHGKQFYYAEKLDGQSCTFFHNSKLNNPLKPWQKDQSFGVCSRNLWLKKESDSNWWRIAKQFDIKNKLKDLNKKTGKNYAIQGEIVGEGIQKNKYGIKGLDFYVFSIFDIDSQKYVNLNVKENVIKFLGLKSVPYMDEFTMDKEIHNVHYFVRQSKMNSTLKNVLAEGVVFRCVNDEHISFKAINPDFLLKNDE